MSKPKQQSLFEEEELPENPMPWERESAQDLYLAQIVLNRPVDRVFHYLVPESMRALLRAGHRVQVPFGRGNQLIPGYCVGVGPADENQPSIRLKTVETILDSRPLFDAKMLKLTRWIADRYLCSWGQVLECVVPAGVKNQAGTRMVTVFELAAPSHLAGDESAALIEKLPAKQRAVFDALKLAEKPLTLEALTQAANCGSGPVQSLKKKSLIRSHQKRMQHFENDDDVVHAHIKKQDDLQLNPDQCRALDQILAAIRGQRSETFVLHGVTGSGKTEVYIQAIREVVSYGQQAIVLVPEISLTPQAIQRFRSRFDSVAVLHSHLSDSDRHYHWQNIAAGKVQVIVGARSAVFAPAPHLGLIIIDEEHETSFKQETAPRYHAREVARQRSELESVPLILGSATPTLNSWLRVIEKKDTLISMAKRVNDLPMPNVNIIDVRNDVQIRRNDSIGRVLFTGMQHALGAGGQVILFLNLRGYSPALWCKGCGNSVKCPHCEISLTWHRDKNLAVCHSCDFSAKPPTHCPGCGAPGLRFVGTGTQRLEEEVKAKFPGYKCQRMDSDTMRGAGSHARVLNAFASGEVDILLGTQMIAKGLDFPNVTLVGVVDADTMLHQPDLFASERTFQLIAQVAGRTGRGMQGGRVFVQTASPSEPAILKAAEHDFLGFAKYEMGHRKEMLAPPYAHYARVILRGPQEEHVQEFARQLSQILSDAAEEKKLSVQILGPAPAPIIRLKKYFRYHFQLAAVNVEEILQLWREVDGKLPREKGIEYIIDVDPVNMR
ncbi:Primosomal protein N' [Gimesia alba]|uniref:Replication restart protein PriA n=1 Tax=Gimesia alba TaxID=2527973 RepID=A0A517RKB4_9PLAN|nr:primosomal protein N' [Gimesia alba]QDT44325.1 Primosomal protein N' [Gimesia alba]